MQLEILVEAEKKYLPDKESKRERTHYYRQKVMMELKEIQNEADFPIAMITKRVREVTEKKGRYLPRKGQKRLFPIEHRIYEGNFYSPLHYVSTWPIVSTHYITLEDWQKDLTQLFRWRSEPLPQNAIITSDNFEKACREMQGEVNKYLLFNGILWERSWEPCYVISHSSKENKICASLSHFCRDMNFEYHCRKPVSRKEIFYASEKEELEAFLEANGQSLGEEIGEETIEILLPETVTKETGFKMSRKLLSLVKAAISFSEFIRLHREAIGAEPSEEYTDKRLKEYIETLPLPEDITDREELISRLIAVPKKATMMDLEKELDYLMSYPTDKIREFYFY